MFFKQCKNIEGTLRREGWCGGYGADDYIINGTYLKDFLKNKQGKYIKIEIFDQVKRRNFDKFIINYGGC